MQRLRKLLLAASSSLLLSALLTSCGEEELVNDHYYHESTIINATDVDLTFTSDDNGEYEICSHDTAFFSNHYESHIALTQDGGNPRIKVGSDSTITLTASNHSCWPYNCQNSKAGEYTWVHTYVIDAEWLTAAWTEAKTGECPPGSKESLYDD